MVEPGCLASSRSATSAVMVLGETGSPALVDDEATVGVTVEGQPEVGLAVGAVQAP